VATVPSASVSRPTTAWSGSPLRCAARPIRPAGCRRGTR
jgi:hypothetical protein